MKFAIGQHEEISRVTPLGLRFWDTLTGQPVGEGLRVTAYPSLEPSRRTTAIMNHSGIYVLHDLPGIRDAEFGAGDDHYWSNVSRKPFVIEVTDLQDRFQSFTFQADLPAQGLFTSLCILASPLLEPYSHLGIPLYSAVTRSIPSGIAVIYATLWDESIEKPASWAVVEAYLEDKFLMRSFADREGRLALLFPYPEPFHSVFPPPGSPLLGRRPPLVDQTWPIYLQAFYTPWQPVPGIPDLCQIFEQSSATLISSLSPQIPMNEILLSYGQKLVLRTASQSSVWVIP